MSDDLTALEDWVTPLLAKLTTAERRNLSRKVARDLRRSQQQRIRRQINPDGTRWEPRKPSLRNQKGSVRRQAMFRRLRTARFMRMETRPDGLALAFMGRVGRIARVHHHGLRDRVSPDGPIYQYPERNLLGISASDRAQIQDSIIDHIDNLTRM